MRKPKIIYLEGIPDCLPNQSLEETARREAILLRNNRILGGLLTQARNSEAWDRGTQLPLSDAVFPEAHSESTILPGNAVVAEGYLPCLLHFIKVLGFWRGLYQFVLGFPKSPP